MDRTKQKRAKREEENSDCLKLISYKATAGFASAKNLPQSPSKGLKIAPLLLVEGNKLSVISQGKTTESV